MYRVLFLILLLIFPACASHHEARVPEPPPGSAPTSAPTDLSAPSTVTLEPAYDLVAEAVTFDAAGTTVHGTLTRPSGSGPFPALLLIAGSGPTDRDWNSTLLPGKNGSGQLLAEALGRRGVVVLRYDKRGTGETEFSGELSWDDYLAEQRAGLALLASRDSVDRSRIYPAGHSEGGIHAVRLAQDPGTPLAGLILLATPGRTMMDTVIGQVRAQIRLGGASAEEEERLTGALRMVLEQVAAGEEIDLSLLGGDLGLLSIAIAFQQKAARDFIQEVLVFDPASALAASGLPSLILTGKKDMQVKPSPDSDLLETAALGAGLPVFRIDIPDTDHTLKKETTPLDQLGPQMAANYNAADRELHPLVVPTIAEWLQNRP
jgi:pimeloyl-ACP methyl ester carboxylesterase